MNDNALTKLSQTLQKIDGAYAHATVRAFRADFTKFIRYCELNEVGALPATPDAVALFVTHLSHQDFASAYIRRIVASISTIHKLNRCPDPTHDPDVKLSVRRMHRLIGRFAHQVRPINKEILDRMVAATDTSLKGLRDRALISIAYDTLCRRSEIVSLLVEDLRIDGDTMTGRILLRRSKTDQEAIGKWLPLRPSTMRAIEAWVARAKIKEGSLFRGITRGNNIRGQLGSGQVGRIYKGIASSIGLDRKVVKEISGHSMRVGAAQDLMKSGASLPEIMVRGRWKKVDTVMRYLEETPLGI